MSTTNVKHMKKTAVAIQHGPFEHLGNLELILKQQQFDVRYIYAWQEPIPASISTDLLIVLGGTMGVYEAGTYPFLSAELNLLKHRLAEDLPTLGICLGAQLMAKALGAEVYRGPQQEIGWAPITLTNAGKNSCLNAFSSIPVFHWHGDTFDLPTGVQLLASSALYQQQAFKAGQKGLALQFHPEVTAEQLREWLKDDVSENSHIDIAKIREETNSSIAALQTQAAQCWQTWLKEINLLNTASC